MAAVSETARTELKKILDGKGSASDARIAIKGVLKSINYQPPDGKEGTIEDLRSFERQNLFIQTNLDLAHGYRQRTLSLDPDVVIAFPAWELFRLEPRKEPRDWPERWMIAANASGDEDAARAFQEFGVMAALKDSGIWSELGSSDNFDDALDTDYTPLAWDSGMWMRDYGREDCLRVGLMDSGDQVEPRKIPPPPPLIPIEDERMAKWFWNQPEECDHCGEAKPRRLLSACDNCGETICPDCKVKGCTDDLVP